MAQYTEEQLSEYKEAFSLYDKKGDGKVDSADLGAALRALGQNPTESEVKKLIVEIDPNGTKRLGFEEVLPLLAVTKKEHGKSEDFVEGLKVFDKEGNGYISAAELRHVLTSLGEPLSDTEMDSLLQGVEVDKEGQVNIEDFVRLIMSG
eukprot:Colp12_sorted_trinity150504_noHs@23796